MKIRLLVLLAFLSATLPAATISYSGTFSGDDEVFQASFSLAAAGTVTLHTTGYVMGGFDPVLSVFESGGTALALNDDGGCGLVGMADTGFCLDSFLETTLAAGTYIFALTQSPNTPLGDLADGFALAGAGDFTGGPFLDVFGNQRTGFWAVTLEGVDTVPVPEPQPFELVCLALGLLVGLRQLRAFSR